MCEDRSGKKSFHEDFCLFFPCSSFETLWFAVLLMIRLCAYRITTIYPVPCLRISFSPEFFLPPWSWFHRSVHRFCCLWLFVILLIFFIFHTWEWLTLLIIFSSSLHRETYCFFGKNIVNFRGVKKKRSELLLCASNFTFWYCKAYFFEGVCHTQ